MPKLLQMGPRKNLDRAEAVEQYIILRLRTEDINRLDFLVHAFYENRIGLPGDSPYSAADLKDTVRTAALGWFATLTNRQPKAVYAFDCLFVLFPHLSEKILKVQASLGAVEDKLHRFRNNVAFHARSDVSAQIAARMNLRDDDTFLDLNSAIRDFQGLMKLLRTEETESMPELWDVLERLHVHGHPAFAKTVA